MCWRYQISHKTIGGLPRSIQTLSSGSDRDIRATSCALSIRFCIPHILDVAAPCCKRIQPATVHGIFELSWNVTQTQYLRLPTRFHLLDYGQW